MKLPIKIKYLDKNVTRLSSPRSGDVGIDIYANETIFLGPNSFVWVHTGVFLEIPRGYWVLVKDRSSRAKHTHVMAGVVDSSYRGEVKVGMYVHSAQCSIFGMDIGVKIQRGDKIAQLIIMEDLNEKFELIEVDSLSETDRGANGFGSTGQ